jgi:hypothetical protein
MPPTAKQELAMTRYADFMEEVKVRLDCMNIALAGKLKMPDLVCSEFCFLQLRMICELTALACLTAHGDISRTVPLQKNWAADQIIEALEGLHPDFYPVSVRQVTTPAGFHLDDAKQTFTKRDLLKLYGRVCGSALHRGSLRQILAPKPAKDTRPIIQSWGQKIFDHLDCHWFPLFVPENRMVCVLKAKDSGDRVSVGFVDVIHGPKPRM